MRYSNEEEWTPWGAVSKAVSFLQETVRTITQNEKDGFIVMGFNIVIWGFSPFVILGFVLISFLWHLGKKAFNNRQR